MAEYTTQPVVFRAPTADNILRIDAPPPGAVCLGVLHADGSLELVPLADLDGGSGAAATIIALNANLDTVRALKSSSDVDTNVRYTITDDRWNGGAGGTAVVNGLTATTYDPAGFGLFSGVWQPATVDVVAGTYVLFVGGAALPQTNVVAVSAAKRMQVVADIAASVANGGQAMILEPDNTLAGKWFKDNRSPSAPYKYEAMQEANPNTGATEVWWNRFRIQ